MAAPAMQAALKWRDFFLKKNLMPLLKSHEKEALLVAVVGACCFYYLSVFSFSTQDASLFSQSFPPSKTQNLGGNFGANISALVFYFTGLGAWLLPMPFIATSLLVLFDSKNPLSLGRILSWMCVIASAVTLLSMQVPTTSYLSYPGNSGGVVGAELAAMIIGSVGKIGGLILTLTLALTSVLLIVQKSLLLPALASLKTHAISAYHNGVAAMRETLAGLWQSDESEKPTKVASAILTSTSTQFERQPEEHNDLMQPQVNTQNDGPLFEMPLVASAQDLAPTPSFPVVAEKRPLSETKTPATTNYVPPPVSIFKTGVLSNSNLSPKELENTASMLIRTLEDFGIKGRVIGYQPGPVVTVFEYQPEAGIKQSKVIGLIDDIALALKVDSIFIHPVRGKRALGIEVPNRSRDVVCLGDIISADEFERAESPLTFGMGKDLSGNPMCVDLRTMPHLLAAGATGSGKSVAVNSLLCSIIMKASPEDVRMILVDPKMLELSVYEGIPHLLMPVITEPDRASMALRWAANEMERRYKLMQNAKVRNIDGFNEFWKNASMSKKQELRDAMNDDEIGKMPYIMLVIDELADLMMTAPKDVESSIQRLAQKARASGIHMVLATQRPSVDIITGVIKANLPCRIAFQVVSKHDSRTILDVIGADKLLGKGDLLLQRPGVGRLERIQGAFISDEEVISLVEAVKDTHDTNYDMNIVDWIEEEASRLDTSSDAKGSLPSMDDDPKYDEAITVAQQHGIVSASFLQRHLKIGYNRAARIVEFMESQGLVGKADGSKPRKWLGPDGQGYS